MRKTTRTRTMKVTATATRTRTTKATTMGVMKMKMTRKIPHLSHAESPSSRSAPTFLDAV